MPHHHVSLPTQSCAELMSLRARSQTGGRHRVITLSHSATSSPSTRIGLKRLPTRPTIDHSQSDSPIRSPIEVAIRAKCSPVAKHQSSATLNSPMTRPGSPMCPKSSRISTTLTTTGSCTISVLSATKRPGRTRQLSESRFSRFHRR